ncbi:MAG: hypothetical protein U0169_22555 [Polyangiaceae bacterium]
MPRPLALRDSRLLPFVVGTLAAVGVHCAGPLDRAERALDRGRLAETRSRLAEFEASGSRASSSSIDGGRARFFLLVGLESLARGDRTRAVEALDEASRRDAEDPRVFDARDRARLAVALATVRVARPFDPAQGALPPRSQEAPLAPSDPLTPDGSRARP